jgi:hypothetical protein
MSTRYNNGSHYENHPKAAELHNGAPHAHSAGEQHGKQEHLTGHEQTRQALEHLDQPHQNGHEATNAHGIRTFGHQEIAELAVDLWRSRGCPMGSPEEDWHRAVEMLRSGAISQ